MKFSVNDKCPCGSNIKYKKCCQLFHKGKIPFNALELMKSRYSAYATNNANYIMKTTHNENIDFTKDTHEWKKSIEEFCKNTDFLSLEILDFKDGENEAFVTFKANLTIDGKDNSFVEESRFFKVDGMWLYHSAKIS